MSLAVVIPVYNEVRNLQIVITDWLMVVSQVDDGRVVAVNDGSTDRSLEILQRLKESNPELIVIDQGNGGHGKAILTGYEYAVKHNFDYIFQVDSDDQIQATHFFRLWRKKGEEQSVLGFREHRQDPLIRKLISRTLFGLTKILFANRIPDLNVPYRLIPRTIMQGFLGQLGSWKPFAPNVFLSLYIQRFPYQIVSVEHRERQSGKNSLSLGKLFLAISRSFIELLRWRVISLRDPQSLS
jgi:glycosyltransferase involved in cell wall biosynthesis